MLSSQQKEKRPLQLPCIGVCILRVIKGRGELRSVSNVLEVRAESNFLSTMPKKRVMFFERVLSLAVYRATDLRNQHKCYPWTNREM